MAQNSHIDLINGGSLTISNSHLKSCGKLWKGITARSGGTIEILDNSIIEDAIQAVTCEADAAYRFENSTLNNNLNGLLITGTANGNINDCQFTNSTGTLLPPYAGEPSNKGIEAWATEDIEIGPGNVFDGLQTGISLWLTNANVNECTFQNLVTDPLQPLNTGIGIYAQGDFGIPGYTPPFTNYTLNVYGMGKNAPSPNFSNLRTGIMLRNMNAKEIINNYMNGVAYGVRAQLCHGGYININENRIANVSNTGILFSNNLGAQILIANNNLSGQKTSINPTGVHIDGFGDKVSNLIVGLNRFDRFTYGVRMNKVSGDGMDIGGMGAHIWNNDFYSTLSASASNIHLTACERVSISENYIEGAPASININPNSASGITNAKHNGVYLQSTANYWLRCNNFDNLSSAIYSFGSNPTGKDNIITNQMHRHFYGWNLRKFGLDGDLGPVGAGLSNRNDFNDPTNNGDPASSYAQIYGFNNTSQITPPNFFRIPNDGAFTFSSNTTTQPFNPITVSGSIADCEFTPEGDLQFLIDDETYYEEANALNIITGTLAQTADPLYQPVVDFEAKRRLYKTIEQDTTLLQSSSNFTNFYNQARYQTIGKLNEIEKDLALLSDSTVLQDTAQVAAIRQSIRSKRESIADFSEHESNEKEILALYDKVLNASDRFTLAEQQFIAGLAYQCPLVAGNGVYLARSLYSLFAEDNEFDDAVNCEGYYKKEQGTISANDTLVLSLALVPNPAKNICLVSYTNNDAGESDWLILCDLDGNTLSRSKIGHRKGSIEINVTDLSRGSYVVRWVKNEVPLFSRKLTVIK